MDTTCIDQKLQAKFKFSDRHQPDKINGLTERHSNQEKQKNEIERWFLTYTVSNFFCWILWYCKKNWKAIYRRSTLTQIKALQMMPVTALFYSAWSLSDEWTRVANMCNTFFIKPSKRSHFLQQHFVEPCLNLPLGKNFLQKTQFQDVVIFIIICQIVHTSEKCLE